VLPRRDEEVVNKKMFRFLLMKNKYSSSFRNK
jgi:hypothetical protein